MNVGLDPEARAIMARLNKKHGEGTTLLGNETREYDRFPTGSLGLDRILGGGWPANQWHEIIGEASASKTSLAFATLAANQRIDPNFTAVICAAEEYVGHWAEACGVDTSRLIVVENNVMEDVYDAALEFTASRSVDCVIIDSLPALVPSAEDEKDMGGFSPGQGAVLTGKFFRKIGKATKRSSTSLDRPFLGIMINQYREKIGVMFGSPITSPGGKGKDFAYFTRVEVKRDEWITAGVGKAEERIGQVVRAKTIKNKTAPPFQEARYNFYFDSGGPVPPGRIDYVGEIVTLGIAFEVVDRAGAYYSFGETRVQGKENFTEAVRSNDDLAKELEQAVLQVNR